MTIRPAKVLLVVCTGVIVGYATYGILTGRDALVTSALVAIAFISLCFIFMIPNSDD